MSDGESTPDCVEEEAENLLSGIPNTSFQFQGKGLELVI